MQANKEGLGSYMYDTFGFEQSSVWDSISPLYMMRLCNQIEAKLWDSFREAKYKNARRYIERWQYYDYDLGCDNFKIIYKNNDGEIDLGETLHSIDNETLIRIALDLGLEVPSFISATSRYIRVLKNSNQNAAKAFEQAVKDVYDSPASSVALANSTLESMLKTIAGDQRLGLTDKEKRQTGGKLAGTVVKKLGIVIDNNQPDEVKTIASSLMSLACAIDTLRSERTNAHGSAPDDYIIDNPLWATLAVNSVATLGLFLWEFYQARFVFQDGVSASIDEEDIPF